MFQAIALPLANRRRLSSRTNLQGSWCPLVSSAPNMPSISALFLYSSSLNSLAAFFLYGLPRLTASFLCLMLGIMPIQKSFSQLSSESYPLSPSKKCPAKSNPRRLISSSMTGSIVVSLTLPRRGERCQYDLQAQNDCYVVFPVCLLTRLDEITLRPVRPLDVLVPCGLRPTAVGPQRARRLAHLLDAAAGRLGQYQIEPVLREGLEVPDQRGVVRDGLAVPGRPHVAQVRFDPAVGPVVRHHQQAGKVQFLLGVDRGTAPAAVFLTRAGVLPDHLDQRPLQMRWLDFLCEFVILPVSFPSVVCAHCRVPEIAIKKCSGPVPARSGRNYAPTPVGASGRQEFQLEAVQAPELLPDQFRPVLRRAVGDHQDLPEPFACGLQELDKLLPGKGAVSLEEPLPVQRDQAEHDGLGVRSRVRVDAADPLGRVDALPEPRVGHTYRLVLHAYGVAGPHPLLYQRPQLLAEPRDLLPACSLHMPSHRNLPGESPAAQQEARVRYRILRQVLYAGTVANDIAQVFCRQVDCLFYFFLTAFRVSLEILGGRPEWGRGVCRPAMPSFRYRLCHLTPHEGAMPRCRAAPVTLIPSLVISTFSIILSLTSGSFSALRILSICLGFMPRLRRSDQCIFRCKTSMGQIRGQMSGFLQL